RARSKSGPTPKSFDTRTATPIDAETRSGPTCWSCWPNTNLRDRQMSKTAKRDLDEWDAEIEDDFRRAVAATKAVGQRKRGRRLIAFPWAFEVDVLRLTRGRTTLVVAQYIYRRTHVCGSKTVTLPSTELAELGIDRSAKQRALAQLEAAELIRIEKAVGQSVKVTLLWQPE